MLCVPWLPFLCRVCYQSEPVTRHGLSPRHSAQPRPLMCGRRMEIRGGGIDGFVEQGSALASEGHARHERGGHSGFCRHKPGGGIRGVTARRSNRPFSHGAPPLVTHRSQVAVRRSVVIKKRCCDLDGSGICVRIREPLGAGTRNTDRIPRTTWDGVGVQ